MDVGNPSNLERLRDLHPEMASLRSAVRAISVDDAAIRYRIIEGATRFGQVWCPHTAVGAEAWARLPQVERRDRSWCIVATASPAKFPEIVEPLLGRKVAVPPALAALFDRPTHVSALANGLGALREVLMAGTAEVAR
jgi:threonine synthase